jgi:hypothetical protein
MQTVIIMQQGKHPVFVSIVGTISLEAGAIQITQVRLT